MRESMLKRTRRLRWLTPSPFPHSVYKGIPGEQKIGYLPLAHAHTTLALTDLGTYTEYWQLTSLSPSRLTRPKLNLTNLTLPARGGNNKQVHRHLVTAHSVRWGRFRGSCPGNPWAWRGGLGLIKDSADMPLVRSLSALP